MECITPNHTKASQDCALSTRKRLGLVSVRTPIEDETKIHEYIGKMAPTDHVLSECLRQQKPEKEEELSWKHRRQHGMHHWQNKWLTSRNPTNG